MIEREFPAVLKRSNGQAMELTVSVCLSYDWENDPLAVQAVFAYQSDGEEQASPWVFDRELLRRGAIGPGVVGEGDVKFHTVYSQDIIMICLKTPYGHADIALPRGEVLNFLQEIGDDLRVDSADEGKVLCEMIDNFLEEVFGA